MPIKLLEIVDTKQTNRSITFKSPTSGQLLQQSTHKINLKALTDCHSLKPAADVKPPRNKRRQPLPQIKRETKAQEDLHTAKVKKIRVALTKHTEAKKKQEQAIKAYHNSHNTFKTPAPRAPKRLLADRDDLPDALLQCKKRFTLKHPPKYYHSLESVVKPKPGYTWTEVELDRTLRSYKQYYNLPEFKHKAEQTRTSDITNAKALIEKANKTSHTWEDFSAFLKHHKSTSHLADATKLYQAIGYHPGLFHTFFLL